MLTEPTASEVSGNNRLSVIIRFHDPRRLPMLEEAVFSLSLQFWRDLETLVMIQNGSEAIEQQVVEVIETQPWLEKPRYRVISVGLPAEFDGRASLLNHGIKNATGRYLAFLDDDDYVYQQGYRDLIEGLRSTSAVLAAGACVVSRAVENNGHWYVYGKDSPFKWGRNKGDLFFDNFIPIHSYVIDRARIAPEDLSFDDQFAPLEDYDFLLRLAAKHSFDFSNLDVPVCEYRYHASNSLQHDEYYHMVLTPGVQRARELIEARKDSLTVSFGLREFLELRAQTIQDPGILTFRGDKKLLIDLMTKQQRSLNQIVDWIYDFSHRRVKLMSAMVALTRTGRRFLRAFSRLSER